MKDARWDVHSEDGDATSRKATFGLFYFVCVSFPPPHPLNVSAVFCGWIWREGGGRKQEKLRGKKKKKNQSVDKVVQHSA